MGRRPLKWPIFKILGFKFWPILAVLTSLKSQFPDFCGDFFVSLNFGILLSGRGQQGSPRWGSNVGLTNIWGGGHLISIVKSRKSKNETWKSAPPPDMGVRPPCDQHLGGGDQIFNPISRDIMNHSNYKLTRLHRPHYQATHDRVPPK